MTGYGKATFSAEGGRYLLEVHGVNRKSLDISMFLPRELLALDAQLRRWLTSYVQRGQITVKLTRDLQGGDCVLPQLSFLKVFKEGWESLAVQLGYSKQEITLGFLVAQLEHMPKVQQTDLEAFLQLIEPAFKEAVEAFLLMKKEEGHQMAQEIVKSLDKIKQALHSLGDYARSVGDEYRQKLETKLKEFDLTSDELKEKIAREVVLYVDKGDITEEIGRLSAHIKSFEDKMHTEGSIGKLMDFIILEMHREANTMGAKSQNLHVTNLALTIKSEIEKMREQIQNIE